MAESWQKELKAAYPAIDAIVAEHDLSWSDLTAKDQEAKDRGDLVGRYLSEPYAYGYAVYDIVAASDDTVDIEVIDIGDAWVIPYWGRRATIDRKYAEKSVRNRDKIEELFSRGR